MTARIMQQLADFKPTPMSLSEDELDAFEAEVRKRKHSATQRNDWSCAHALHEVLQLLTDARELSHQTRVTARSERLIARQARHLKTLRHPKP